MPSTIEEISLFLLQNSPESTRLWGIVGWVIAGLLWLQVLPLGISMLFPRRLLSEKSKESEEEFPSLAVVVAARDEQEGIGSCVQSLLEQDYPQLTIVAVNDRSTDRTPQILDELARSDSRLQVIHIEELPSGWLGKNHANWVGAMATPAQWLLFTDGDVSFRPQALKRAIQHARITQSDHLTAFPQMDSGGLWESLMICTFTMFFFFKFQPWLVRTKVKWAYMGIGAFNLISREAYERIGTHEELKMEVADDIKLGKRIKQFELQQDVVDGTELCSVRWQVGLKGFIHGLTKNAFAGLEYSLFLATFTTLAFIGIYCSPYFAVIFFSGADSWGYWASIGSVHLAFLLVLIQARQPIYLVVLLPIAEWIFLYTIWRSVVITLKQGGVRWRDTFYPLDELKRGLK